MSVFNSEAEYRACIKKTVDQIGKAFENVDPDVAECEMQFGALTILITKGPKGAKCILSAQPSVQQLWLAIASRGVAFHFNYDPAVQKWLDDKGKNIELTSYLNAYLLAETGLDLKLAAIGG